MPNLKLGLIPNEKPVKLTVELPAVVHRSLLAYAEVLGRATGQRIEAAQLVAPMVSRFMATDRAFAKARATAHVKPADGSPGVLSREDEKLPETA